MQDVRLRVISAAILSAAAFSGIPGAAAALLWWIMVAGLRRGAKTVRRVIAPLLLIAVIAAVIAFTGGQGVPYGVRMGVIVIISSWVYDEYRPGEFMDLAVWFLGNRAGFELGMIAEMGMQWLELLRADFTRIRMAFALKGVRGIRTILPLGFVLIHASLSRAGDTAGTLAVRGYRDGGTYFPAFRSGRFDLLGFAGAIMVGIFAVASVSEFFILYR